MSNYQEQKKLSNFPMEKYVDFLMDNGYLGEMKMLDTIELTSNDSYVSIPRVRELTKEQIITSLKTTKLSFDDFEVYLDHLKAMESMLGWHCFKKSVLPPDISKAVEPFVEYSYLLPSKSVMEKKELSSMCDSLSMFLRLRSTNR